MTARPVIGVTGPSRGGGPAWLFTAYAIWRAGGRPRRVSTAHPIDPTAHPVDPGSIDGHPIDPGSIDGLVIGGGADVSEPPEPGTETEPPPSGHVRWPRRLFDLLIAPLVLLIRLLGSVKRHGVDPDRDALEARLIRHAEQQGLPVLGICRGAQLMNRVAGGTLMRDVDSMYSERPQLYTVLPRREVLIAPESRLREVVGRSALLVNSLHFHAVDNPGRGLQIVAREPSGVPQAIEHPGRPFWLGVQWHPEYLPQQQAHQQLFRALVGAARVPRQPPPASPTTNLGCATDPGCLSTNTD